MSTDYLLASTPATASENLEVIKRTQLAAAEESWYILGLRCDSRDLGIGEEVGDSYRWDDGEDTGEQLDGTCAIDATREDAIALISRYTFSGHLYLIGSQTNYYGGEDKGEIVIQNAVVIARF